MLIYKVSAEFTARFGPLEIDKENVCYIMQHIMYWQFW